MAKKKKVNTEKEKLALEKQLVKEGKIFPRARYAPRGRLRGIVALCLVFLLGIFAGLGSVVGVGVYVSTRKLKDVFSIVGADATDYFTETYAEMSMIDLVADIATTPITSFDSLAKYTPIVRETVETMVEQIDALGMEIDVDTLMQIPFEEFGTYLHDDVIMKVELGKVLGIDADSDPLMRSLCYGKEGVDYRIEYGMIVMLDGKEPAYLQTLVDGATDMLGSLCIGDLLSVTDDAAPIMQAIKDWDIGDLSNPMRINRLKIKQVIDLGDEPSTLLSAICDWRIGELSDQSKLDSLCLGDVIPVDSDSAPILRALANVQIGDLDAKVQTLRLNEIMDEKDLEGNRILKHLGNSTVSTLSDDLSVLSVGQTFGDQAYAYMPKTEGNSFWNKYEDYFGDRHYMQEAYNTDAARPKAIEGVAEDPTFHSYRMVGTREVTVGYYTKEGDTYVPLPAGCVAQYDAEIARDNRDPNLPEGAARSPWYFESKIPLTPVYSYSVVDYDAGQLILLPAHVVTTRLDGSPVYTDEAGVQHILSEDDYSFYYEDPVKGRIDFDRSVGMLTAPDGAVYTRDETTGRWRDANGDSAAISVSSENGEEVYVCTRRIEAFERYSASNDDRYYTVEETEEHYAYSPDGTPVELDRYLTGIWYLLLAKEEKTADGVTTAISFNTDIPVLELDSLIEGISGALNDYLLAELWFHGILEENPYVEIPTPIRIYTSRGTQSDEKGAYIDVENLIEVRLGETVALVSGLVEQIG